MKRLIMLFIILMAGMAGCGTAGEENGSQSEENQNSGAGEDISVQKGIVAGEMEPSITKQEESGQVVYVYSIKNQTEQEKTFVFSSGQTIDFELRNDKGVVVYKDSKNKMYTQAIQEITVKQGEEFSQKVVLPKVEGGTYTLTVWLTAKGDQNYKATTEVQVN
jgi:Intracellular proteinase inhibitor